MVKIGHFSHWMIVTFWRALACLLAQLSKVLEVKSHPQQGRLHDSLIVKLSGIGSIQIFNCSVLSPVVFHRMAIKCFSIFAAASGVYPEVFAWSGIGILLYILSYRIKKRKKLTYELWKHNKRLTSGSIKPVIKVLFSNQDFQKWYSDTQTVIC